MKKSPENFGAFLFTLSVVEGFDFLRYMSNIGVLLVRSRTGFFIKIVNR